MAERHIFGQVWRACDAKSIVPLRMLVFAAAQGRVPYFYPGARRVVTY